MIREILQKARAGMIEQRIPPPFEVRLTASTLDKLAVEMLSAGELRKGDIPKRFMDMALIADLDVSAGAMYVQQPKIESLMIGSEWEWPSQRAGK